MILCHNCLHKEKIGAVYCSECGSQLVFSEGVPTSGIQANTPTTQDLVPPETSKPVTYPFTTTEHPTTSAPINVMLNLVATGDVISLADRDEATLGRVSEGQPIIPDIDLSPFKAYEAGVSRMHASIRIRESAISVTDLGSANGTRINGRQISSHIPYPIKSGDILTLGKFKIQVLVETSQRNIGG
jgi:pSer/pThr/pTyr-binding forkhead associated (FHA) protein